MKKVIRKVLTIAGAIIFAAIAYFVFLAVLFIHLYSPNSKEVIFKQETGVGVFSLVLDTGDPLSHDAWEYRIDEHVINKEYVNYTNHIDTLFFNQSMLLLETSIEYDGSMSFDIKEYPLLSGK